MKIGVVLVTRNRAECLKIALDKYDMQTKQPEYIVVVNNCSTDNGITEKVLEEWKSKPSNYEKIVITSQENSGGSGGFWIAENEAIKHDAEWIWHADDDAYPEEKALEMIERAYISDNNGVAAYCASVRDIENPRMDISCWRKLYKGLFFIKWIHPKMQEKYFDVDKFMYLGSVISKEAIKQVGFTNKDFFIHEDDIEHSMRIRKFGRIVAVMESHLLHPAWKDSRDVRYINWKYYYLVRNKIISIGNNYGEKYRKSEIVKAKLKMYIHILKKYPKDITLMEKDAIRDGKNNVLGKNSIYSPK